MQCWYKFYFLIKIGLGTAISNSGLANAIGSLVVSFNVPNYLLYCGVFTVTLILSNLVQHNACASLSKNFF
jgi:hypothetical protein